MRNNEWEKYKQAYHLRSIKYLGGKPPEFSRKHEGLAEYIDIAIQKVGAENFSFCDAGCGHGVYLKYVGANHSQAKLYGFDFAETITEIAKKNAPGAEIIVGNLEAAPYQNESFNLILCTQVIEHLLDDKLGIAELYRLLKPGGYLIISTDNENNKVSKFLNLPIALLAVPYRFIKKKLPDKKYFPHRSYKIKEFTALIKTRPFTIEKISTFRFSLPWPLYKIKMLNRLLNKFETLVISKKFFSDSGDIVAALCKK